MPSDHPAHVPPSTQRRTEQTAVRRGLLVVGAVTVLALAVVGIVGRSGPATTAFGSAQRVLIVSVPGLQWGDLDASATPHLDALLRARGLLSVRTAAATTSVVDGYLTMDAGNRLSIDRAAAAVVVRDGCADVMTEASAAASDQLAGAEPGALGDALHAAGRTTAVIGPDAAVLGLMDGQGCVDAVRPAADPAAISADVTLLELGGLEGRATAAERLAALSEIDGQLGGLDVPSGTLVLVVAPVAPDQASEVTVIGAALSGTPTDALQLVSSGTTRRAGYATMPDVAPTVLAALGISAPASMTGTEIRSVVSTGDGATDASLADLAARVAFRDKAVGPVAVVLVVFVSLCGLAALGRRARLARMFAPIAAAYLSVTFLAGLVAFHHLPLDFVAVAVPVVATTVAAVATAGWSRWGRWAPVSALLALLWVVLVVDIVTGGALQINTALGYTPTIAGRFQGFGNLASALVASSALAVAVIPVLWSNAITTWHRAWMAWVGAVTLVAVAAPAFGSDVGGTLVLVPAFIVLAFVATGRRIDVRKLALAVVSGIVVVVGLAAIDLARPAASRTHLGRFADRVVHGEAGTILRRKLRGNLDMLTASFWSMLLFALLVGALVWAWRCRSLLTRRTEGQPALRLFLIGFVVSGVSGFAVNDSGIAIPAIMLTVGIPWVVSVVVAPTVRDRG